MFCSILTLGGAIIMVYAASLCHLLKKKIKDKIKNKINPLVLISIYFFLAGYIYYLMLIIRADSSCSTQEKIVSAIFFLGAIFVVITLKINHKLIIKLAQETKNLHITNSNIETINKQMLEKEEALKISEKKYRERSDELEKSMEDFYSLRLKMEQNTQEKSIKKENQAIKNKLDEIKKD